MAGEDTAARLSAAIAGTGAAAVLGAALFLQHALGVAPCHLCLVERWPHYAALAACLAALAPGAPPRLTRGLVAAAAALFAAAAALAAYHSGVEARILPAPAGCASASLPAAGSVEAFLAQLRDARVVPCDAVSFRILGASLAAWNLAASLALLAASLLWTHAPGRRALARLPAAPAAGRGPSPDPAG